MQTFKKLMYILSSTCVHGTIFLMSRINSHVTVLEPTTDPFVTDLSRKLCEINMFVRGKYGPLCCLVDVLGARAMLKIHPSIPEDIMFVMTDQTVVPHVRACAFINR